jgi:hypothetical protein
VLAGRRHDRAVVLEPRVDARDAVPKEPFEVLADGMKRVIRRHDADGVLERAPRDDDGHVRLEPQPNPVDVLVGERPVDRARVRERRRAAEHDALLECGTVSA